MQAIQVTLSTGEVLQISPREYGQAAIVSVDDLRIGVTKTDKGFDVDFRRTVVSGQARAALVPGHEVEVVEVRPDEIEKKQAPNQEESSLRRCIICGPRYYCISGGCLNTPCGWICG